MDWVKFLGTAIVGLVSIKFHSYLGNLGVFLIIFQFLIPWQYIQVAVVSSLEIRADLWVVIAVLSTLIGYCAKTYFAYVLYNLCFCFFIALASTVIWLKILVSSVCISLTGAWVAALVLMLRYLTERVINSNYGKLMQMLTLIGSSIREPSLGENV